MNPPRKPVVLIVDDTPTNIQVLAEALRADYRVKVAGSGKMALDIVQQGQPDLILLDVMMPDMDGYEVCRTLKNNPQTQNIPVIFVTARTDTVDETFGLQLGAVDYIAKPFRLPIVLARVRNHIALKLKSDLLESHALLDGLTSIPNRRRFDQSLETEWKRAQRSGLPLSVLMFDIDHFKAYNDSLGHRAGDDCLTRVAMLLCESLERPGDLLARYGGEEFVALLPETDAEGAARIAERCRVQIEAARIPHPESGTAGWVTVSIGVGTLLPDGAANSGTLIEQADARLYCAKSAGRNRVCSTSKE